MTIVAKKAYSLSHRLHATHATHFVPPTRTRAQTNAHTRKLALAHTRKTRAARHGRAGVVHLAARARTHTHNQHLIVGRCEDRTLHEIFVGEFSFVP